MRCFELIGEGMRVVIMKMGGLNNVVLINTNKNHISFLFCVVRAIDGGDRLNKRIFFEHHHILLVCKITEC